jgi:hypothetical protein
MSNLHLICSNFPFEIFGSGWSNTKNLFLRNLYKAYFTGSIYGRFSIKFPHFIWIGQNKWSPWAILVSDWLKF